MTPEQRSTIALALARYGARLTDDDAIAKGERVFNVSLEIKAGRFRILGAGTVGLLAGYPAAKLAEGVRDFVEKFWFWTPTAKGGAS